MGWWISTLAALVPLAAAAALLVYRWNAIPARFPIHWGLNGQPNGWSTRTPLGVFGILIIGVVTTLFMTLLGALTTRSSAGFSGRAMVVRTTRNVLRAGAWFVGLLFSFAGLLPLMSNPSRMVPWLLIAGFAFAISAIAYFAVQFARKPEVFAAARESTPERCWKGGLIYYNPADSALMVPKRTGLGYTLNFAHPIAWILLAGVILLAFVFPMLLHHHG